MASIHILKKNLISVKKLMQPVADVYPQHNVWYDQKFVPDFHQNRRNILSFETKSQSAAIALLKNDPVEKKICTLFVGKDYRRIGLAERLLVASMNVLGTEKPYITVSSERIDQLGSMLEAYNYNLSYIVGNILKPDQCEYHYNAPKKDPRKLGDLYTNLYQDPKTGIWQPR